ncbi:hypothetical protein HDU78_008628 [Chytriomyces hyalinus]|nr:hypothetical protein HDU78_008628 [Chytriomyces hyalinus]
MHQTRDRPFEMKGGSASASDAGHQHQHLHTGFNPHPPAASQPRRTTGSMRRSATFSAHHPPNSFETSHQHSLGTQRSLTFNQSVNSIHSLEGLIRQLEQDGAHTDNDAVSTLSTLKHASRIPIQLSDIEHSIFKRRSSNHSLADTSPTFSDSNSVTNDYYSRATSEYAAPSFMVHSEAQSELDNEFDDDDADDENIQSEPLHHSVTTNNTRFLPPLHQPNTPKSCAINSINQQQHPHNPRLVEAFQAARLHPSIYTGAGSASPFSHRSANESPTTRIKLLQETLKETQQASKTVIMGLLNDMEKTNRGLSQDAGVVQGLTAVLNDARVQARVATEAFERALRTQEEQSLLIDDLVSLICGATAKDDNADEDERELGETFEDDFAQESASNETNNLLTDVHAKVETTNSHERNAHGFSETHADHISYDERSGYLETQSNHPSVAELVYSLVSKLNGDSTEPAILSPTHEAAENFDDGADLEMLDTYYLSSPSPTHPSAAERDEGGNTPTGSHRPEESSPWTESLGTGVYPLIDALDAAHGRIAERTQRSLETLSQSSHHILHLMQQLVHPQVDKLITENSRCAVENLRMAELAIDAQAKADKLDAEASAREISSVKSPINTTLEGFLNSGSTVRALGTNSVTSSMPDVFQKIRKGSVGLIFGTAQTAPASMPAFSVVAASLTSGTVGGDSVPVSVTAARTNSLSSTGLPANGSEVTDIPAPSLRPTMIQRFGTVLGVRAEKRPESLEMNKKDTDPVVSAALTAKALTNSSTTSNSSCKLLDDLMAESETMAKGLGRESSEAPAWSPPKRQSVSLTPFSTAVAQQKESIIPKPSYSNSSTAPNNSPFEAYNQNPVAPQDFLSNTSETGASPYSSESDHIGYDSTDENDSLGGRRGKVLRDLFQPTAATVSPVTPVVSINVRESISCNGDATSVSSLEDSSPEQTNQDAAVSAAAQKLQMMRGPPRRASTSKFGILEQQRNQGVKDSSVAMLVAVPFGAVSSNGRSAFFEEPSSPSVAVIAAAAEKGSEQSAKEGTRKRDDENSERPAHLFSYNGIDEPSVRRMRHQEMYSDSRRKGVLLDRFEKGEDGFRWNGDETSGENADDRFLRGGNGGAKSGSSFEKEKDAFEVDDRDSVIGRTNDAIDRFSQRGSGPLKGDKEPKTATLQTALESNAARTEAEKEAKASWWRSISKNRSGSKQPVMNRQTSQDSHQRTSAPVVGRSGSKAARMFSRYSVDSSASVVSATTGAVKMEPVPAIPDSFRRRNSLGNSRDVGAVGETSTSAAVAVNKSGNAGFNQSRETSVSSTADSVTKRASWENALHAGVRAGSIGSLVGSSGTGVASGDSSVGIGGMMRKLPIVSEKERKIGLVWKRSKK